MKRHQPTEQEGRESLITHALDKALEAREAYCVDGGGLTMDALNVLLCDRKFVRHPVRLEFDAAPLASGEFAHPEPIVQDDPSAGFIMFIHPNFEGADEIIPLLVAYQLVTINYGEIAGPEAAESYGAALCGLDTESYYQTLCQLSDSLA